ncbi:Cytochrome P450 monooxygenase cypX [Psilocybe cubensis]|uniref:Cytochrome P450 n=2 Tax=Psilocybe cubensis TaxID=181762 RepID=A0A8H7XXJ7_PSICU|nr:Cytochrome P450 monooxygenase cypX [Psilocybe cubensis]KAH9482159.1 Cytochrome P450 monooxygenase cypX [Psilocybe cubensis]
MFSAVHFSASWCTTNFFLIAISIAVAYFLLHAFYNLFLSPLSAIPGPWYYSISDLFITSQVVRLRQCKAVQSLFEIYGPVVRIGPNKVVFRDISTMRNVYSVHKFDKSTFYKSLLTNDNDHAMTTLDHASHSIRRKSYAQHYTPSNVAQFQPEMHEFTFQLINSLENIGGKSPVECLALFRHLMVDVVVSSSFGYRLGAVGKWAMDVEDPLSTAINDFPKRGILRSIVPAWTWNLVCRIPNNRWRQMCDSDKILAEFVSARVYEMRGQLNAGKLGDSEKTSMLQRLLQYKYTPNQQMPDHDIISECIGHFMAGTDTTSTSITYLFWELSRRPDIMKKLQCELDEAIPDSKVLPEMAVLQDLPYLSAFMKEGLRVYTAVPSLLERVVPSSTSKNGATDEIFDLMGYALPPGTTVATQAWSMHRDSTVFPSPDKFIPERWLESSSTTRSDLAMMAAHMMPFGTGTRVCGGQNLALMMLRLAVAAFVRNFDISAPSETTAQSMDIKDSFVIFPSAMECKLIFTPRATY